MDNVLDVVLEAARDYEKRKGKTAARNTKSKNQKNKKSYADNMDKASKTDINPNKSISDQKEKYTPATDASIQGLFPQINSDNLLQGILWAEILGKPVSKRRGRW